MDFLPSVTLAAQGLRPLAASPLDKFMSGLADMMSGPQLDGPELGSMDIVPEEEAQEEDSGNMEAFRKTLIRQSRYLSYVAAPTQRRGLVSSRGAYLRNRGTT